DFVGLCRDIVGSAVMKFSQGLHALSSAMRRLLPGTKAATRHGEVARGDPPSISEQPLQPRVSASQLPRPNTASTRLRSARGSRGVQPPEALSPSGAAADATEQLPRGAAEPASTAPRSLMDLASSVPQHSGAQLAERVEERACASTRGTLRGTSHGGAFRSCGGCGPSPPGTLEAG
ncbi:hypothetical protein CYMTET_33415, partial [Cymbomonas tetramitiformis]